MASANTKQSAAYHELETLTTSFLIASKAILIFNKHNYLWRLLEKMYKDFFIIYWVFERDNLHIS